MEEFKLEVILDEFKKFLYGDFMEGCKAQSLEPFYTWGEESFKKILAPFAHEANESYHHFKKVADKLEDYVVEYSKEHSNDFVSIALLMGKITRIKEKYESIITNGWIKGIIKDINAESEKYFTKVEDYVDEESGRVLTIKRFSKKVPYIYEWNFDVYEIYFKLATRELWLLLKSYAIDYKEGRIPPRSERVSLSGEEYTKELINESIPHLKKVGKLPLSLKVYDERTKASLGRCFDSLSHSDEFTEKPQRTAFINLFSKAPVETKVVWRGTRIELAYFIEGIKGVLDIVDNRWFAAESCFIISDGDALGRRSLIDAVAKNSMEANGEKFMVLKDKEQQVLLDKAIKRFKDE